MRPICSWMYRALVLWSFMVLAVPLMAQEHWARRAGAWSNDAYNGMVVDAGGNSYVVGEFGGVVNMNGAVITSAGSLDVLVAKYGPNGNLLWARSFGGPGLDRGSAVALGPSGTLAVTGQFMGTMDADAQQLTASGLTRDVFVLSLSTVNGAVLWAGQGGGPLYEDQPNAVSVAPDGSVVVTGEFRGTAQFTGNTITSMIDPDTGLPSVDIFVAAYNATGDLLWLKHGAAKYADRGLAVAHDPAGNVYVTGQFSDTLTIDQTHYNQMYSAIFIARFAPNGTEQWFRVFGGGTYNQVFAITVVEGDRLLLTGDLQGTVIFQDSQPDLFTASMPRSSFLVEVDLDGEFIRQTTWGSEHVVNTRALSVQGNEVAVIGRFHCQFTGFSALSGDGTWLATGPHDLYVARFDLDLFTLKDAQQFGGQRNKVPGGIGHLPDDQLVFCGSFDHLLVFPSRMPQDFSLFPTVGGVATAAAPVPYCDDDHYGSYVGLRGSALMDAFIAKGFVSGRAPYDIFARDPGPCERPQRDLRIRMNMQGVAGPDSLEVCNEAELTADTRTAFTADTTQRHNAPHMHFLWNTGDTTMMITVNSTGWYHVVATSQAGCWVRDDSVHVTVHPLPTVPLVSDDVVVNTEAAVPQNITVCEPQYPWLWATNIAPGHSVQWGGPPGVVQGDSIQATITGLYGVSVTSPEGCVRQNNLWVTITPSGPLPPLDAMYDILFPQDTDLDDTVRICMNAPLIFSMSFQLYLDGQVVPLPYGVQPMISVNGSPWSSLLNSWPVLSAQQYMDEEGWYTFDAGLLLTNAPCGEDSLFFWQNDSIYVIPFALTQPMVSLSGPALICPGDTASVILSCTNCTSWSWTGAQSAVNYQDSLHVFAPGIFGVQAMHVDTNGCETNASASHQVQWNPDPLLGVLPTDGIICPDSVAIIYTTAQGSNYQWYGPLGPLNVDNDTIITSQPGLYYLEMEDLLGCTVTSDAVLVTDYATPYLNVLPDNVLCEPGHEATLQVVTTSESTIQWWAPLSGSATEQVVDQPGIYTCSVSACGITHELSVEIFGNNAMPLLEDPGPFTLCPGQPVVLLALPGNAITYWLPGPVFSSELTVSQGGVYTLVATDANGCQAQVDVLVEQFDWEVPLAFGDTTICAGTPLVLEVTGSGDIAWFGDPAMQQWLGSGPLYDVGIPVNDLVLYVVQEEGPCTSVAAALAVQVLPLPEGAYLEAPAAVCAGQPLEMTVSGGQATDAIWTTPQGAHQGTVYWAEASPAHAGTYVVVPWRGPCPGDSLFATVAVLIPEPPYLGPDTVYCEGGHTLLFVPEGYSQPWWTTGSEEPYIMVTEGGSYGLEAIDPQGCPVFAAVVLEPVPCDLDLPNVITPNGDGHNDTWWLGPGLYPGAWMEVYNRWGDLVWEGDPTHERFNALHYRNKEPLSDGVYYYVLAVRLHDDSAKRHQGYLHVLR